MSSTMAGWIYFAQAPRVNKIKIGFTRVPHRRLKILNDQYRRSICRGRTISYIGLIAGTLADEYQLHRRFDSLRIRKTMEWYHRRPELLAFIQSLTLLSVGDIITPAGHAAVFSKRSRPVGYLSVAEAADRLNLTPLKVRALIHAGSIGATRTSPDNAFWIDPGTLYWITERALEAVRTRKPGRPARPRGEV